MISRSPFAPTVLVFVVARDVVVERDGSGGIRVRQVRGDFRVNRDGSGRVTYADVSGGVDIPSSRR